jgi:hypothetical protein
MSVIITFMFEPAKLQMNCASASGRISLRADASGRSDAGSGLTDTDRSLSCTDLSSTPPNHRSGRTRRAHPGAVGCLDLSAPAGG